jgi:XRE family transcriptional regulator, regulator of sulfur utilization
MVFGEIIRGFRENKGWSQMDLAAKADIHLNALGNIERGDRTPNLRTVLVLCRALGIKPSDLFSKIDIAKIKL